MDDCEVLFAQEGRFSLVFPLLFPSVIAAFNSAMSTFLGPRKRTRPAGCCADS